MSNVSNIHQFAPLNKDSKALSGQRLIRLIAKKSKGGEYENPNLQGSLCVSVPVLMDDQVIDRIDHLMPHMVQFVRDTQDKIVREWRLVHGRDEIPENAFDVDAVIGYLDAAATGDRFTTEYLADWFMSEYATLARSFIERAIHGAAEEIISAKTNVLRDMFTGFASGRYSPNIPVCKAIEKFGQFCADNGEIDSKMTVFVQKANDIRVKKELELSESALGF